MNTTFTDDQNFSTIINSIKIGDIIDIILQDDECITGRYMPRYESSTKDHIVIKLKSGYNIGLNTKNIKSIKISTENNIENNKSKVQKKNNDLIITNLQSKQNNTLPKILLLSTGGTIASKIDYRTGGVKSLLSANDVYSSIPELIQYAYIDTEVLINEYSENIEPIHWTLIANKVVEKCKSEKYQGIIISHGTDTMSYTATALSFALQKLPIPVVLVGSQRSSDRPSSDASSNLIGAIKFITHFEYSGVYVAMHNSTSDDTISCHIGTRVRKNHTSKRNAFESIDIDPVAIVKNDKIEISRYISNLNLQKKNTNYSNVEHKSKFNTKVFLLKFFPGFNPKIIDTIFDQGYKIIIIEGTGLGHINKNCISSIKNVIDNGILVFMTSQCIWGRTNLSVYDNGRDLKNIGIIPLYNMLSETALVKAMWLLANNNDKNNLNKYIKLKMNENLANEILFFSLIQ